MQNNWENFEKYLDEINKIQLAIKNMNWQLKTSAGVKSKDNAVFMVSSLGYLQGLVHEKITSGDFVKLVSQLSELENLSALQKRAVEYWNRETKEAVKLTKEQSIKRVELKNKANQKWESARANNSFDEFKDIFKELVEYEKEIYSIIHDKPACYDIFLDNFVPKWKSCDIDELFNSLKEGLYPIIEKYKIKNDFDFLTRTVEPQAIDEALELISADMGFDFDRGKIEKSVHPFTSGLNPPYDVRYTVRYYSDKPTLEEMIYNILVGMHECGHALVGQNTPAEFERLGIGELDVDLHESQSRMWENIIGRSKEFWAYLLPKLKELSPSAFDGVEVDDIYKYVNAVEYNPIRVEADEAGYNLHIILRYEIEKMFFNSEFDYKMLPEIWNKKVGKLFNETPENDIEGVLQDVHWSFGYVGYFPSYALGNIMSAQIFDKVKKDIPNIMDEIECGNFKVLTNWLVENIYKTGKLKSSKELVEDLTGKPLSSKYLIDYLEEKYTGVYS